MRNGWIHGWMDKWIDEYADGYMDDINQVTRGWPPSSLLDTHKTETPSLSESGGDIRKQGNSLKVAIHTQGNGDASSRIVMVGGMRGTRRATRCTYHGALRLIGRTPGAAGNWRAPPRRCCDARSTALLSRRAVNASPPPPPLPLRE